MFRNAIARNVRLFTSSARAQKSVIDSAKETAQKVDRTVSDAAVKGIERGEQAAGNLKQTAGANAQKAQATASEAAGKAQGTASQATGQASGSASQTAGQASGKASELAGEAKGKASELAGQAKGKAEEIKSKM